MAQQPAAERNSASIARAGKHRWGYDTGKVDSFLERAHTLYEDAEPRMSQEDIQNVSFPLEKDGYVISQVDAALNRLEKAVVDKQTQWDVNSFGRVAWRATTEQLAHSLYGRAKRPDKERFDPGEAKQPSYDRKQVDRLVRQLVDKIRRELGETRRASSDDGRKADAELNATRVANIIFTQRKGRRGYSERQVDAYLNRAVQVLARLESFTRLEGPLAGVPSDGEANAAASVPDLDVAAPAAGAAAAGVGAAAGVAAAVPAAIAPEHDDDRDSSFYDLRQAETEIFSGAGSDAPAADTPAAGASGSLAGLVNAAAKPAPTAANDTPTTTIPGLPDHTTAAADAAPAEPAMPASFPVNPAPAPAPATDPLIAAPTVGGMPASSAYATDPGFTVPQPEQPVPPAFPVDTAATTAMPAPAPAPAATAFDPAPAAFAAPASEPEPQTETGHARHAAPASDGTDATKSAEDTSGTGTSDSADDYFSTLLDTSSIPPVDFHIPNLTFPAADDTDDTTNTRW